MKRTLFQMLNFLRGKSKRFLMLSILISFVVKTKIVLETNYSKAIRGVQYLLEIEGIAPSNTSCQCIFFLRYQKQLTPLTVLLGLYQAHILELNNHPALQDTDNLQNINSHSTSFQFPVVTTVPNKSSNKIYSRQ